MRFASFIYILISGTVRASVIIHVDAAGQASAAGESDSPESDFYATELASVGRRGRHFKNWHKHYINAFCEVHLARQNGLCPQVKIKYYFKQGTLATPFNEEKTNGKRLCVYKAVAAEEGKQVLPDDANKSYKTGDKIWSAEPPISMTIFHKLTCPGFGYLCRSKAECASLFSLGPPGAKAAAPVNCIMDNWGAWGKCSSSCGAGTQTRTRTVQRESAHTGTPCPTDRLQNQACNGGSSTRRIAKTHEGKVCYNPAVFRLASYWNTSETCCAEACKQDKTCTRFAVPNGRSICDSQEQKAATCFLYQAEASGSQCKLVGFQCMDTFEVAPYQESDAEGGLLIENAPHADLALGAPKFPDPMPEKVQVRRHT
mmetsp:Transcript_95590/g.169744  ORF Transcript_95590/g.169744 Transcript_95590/m.169744 type:complete len:371 (-) Transcript_95590:221-1333(-)